MERALNLPRPRMAWIYSISNGGLRAPVFISANTITQASQRCAYDNKRTIPSLNVSPTGH